MRWILTTTVLLWLAAVAIARSDLCCRRQRTCVCVFPEGEDEPLRRFAPGAVEFVRVAGAAPPSPTLFSLRYKPHPRKEPKAEDTGDPLVRHLMQWLTIELDVYGFFPEAPFDLTYTRDLKTTAMETLRDRIAAEEFLPRLSVKSEYILRNTDNDVDPESEGFVEFDRATMDWSAERRSIPDRWAYLAGLRLQLNESAVLHQPAVLAFRWHSRWESVNQSALFERAVMVNVSVRSARWTPSPSLETLADPDVKVQQWNRASIAVVGDAEWLQAITEKNPQAEGLSGCLHYLWLWLKYAERRFHLQAIVLSVLLLGGTTVSVWGFPKLKRKAINKASRLPINPVPVEQYQSPAQGLHRSEALEEASHLHFSPGCDIPRSRPPLEPTTSIFAPSSRSPSHREM